jgi:putative FmdB family regulatory protein
MPIYLYRCRKCGHRFEMLRGINEDDSGIKCPECGMDKQERGIMPFNSGSTGAERRASRFG